jgi:uncharacterized membrane protein YjjP (DUF1212 family)
MNNDEIFSLSLDIGKAIIKSGGEVYRAEDTIRRINNAYGNECSVFAIPSLIIAQSGNNIQIRKIDYEEIDLTELARLNQASRKLCTGKNIEVSTIKNEQYTKIIDILCTSTATAVFCLLFQGTKIDAIFSAIIGLIITYMPYKKFNLPLFSSNLVDSFIAGILANIPTLLGINVQPDKIIIGTIMLLVPGLTVVNAMRDMMNGDLIAGMFELFNAIMSALGIALGIAVAILIFTKIL